jgi:hypothetical protein
MSAVRFKDIEVGTDFLIQVGGPYGRATKVSPTQFTMPKLNSPGTVTFDVDPELNQDDCFPQQS